jgi:hypothetical protein
VRIFPRLEGTILSILAHHPRHEICQSQAEATVMNIEERRIILDRGFDRALSTVLDAFLHERFEITPTGAGDVHRPGSPGRSRRYAILDATIPELECGPRDRNAAALGLACHVSVFELDGSCTLVTVGTPVAPYPVVEKLVARVSDRISRVVHELLAAGNLNAA